MPHRITLCSFTAPLPGWRRLRNIHTGRTMDFNEANADHAQLMAYFIGNPRWQDITDQFCDTYTEDK